MTSKPKVLTFNTSPSSGLNASVNASVEEEVMLPHNFQPTKNTVIVGRGRIPQENPGNRQLRALVTECLTLYAKATTKKMKSTIVLRVLGYIHGMEGGIFVRYRKNKAKGSTNWYRVTDSVAREKVGYVFRDLLGDRYRSSSKSKVARRHHELYLQGLPSRCSPSSLSLPAMEKRLDEENRASDAMLSELWMNAQANQEHNARSDQGQGPCKEKRGYVGAAGADMNAVLAQIMQLNNDLERDLTKTGEESDLRVLDLFTRNNYLLLSSFHASNPGCASTPTESSNSTVSRT